MSSRKRLAEDDRAFAAAIGEALKGSVRFEKPSPAVREAILRAASDASQERARATRAAYDHSFGLWHKWEYGKLTESPVSMLVLHAQLLNLRAIQ